MVPHSEKGQRDKTKGPHERGEARALSLREQEALEKGANGCAGDWNNDSKKKLTAAAGFSPEWSQGASSAKTNDASAHGRRRR
jgi:hypothetical protein